MILKFFINLLGSFKICLISQIIVRLDEILFANPLNLKF